jgi:histidine triad (HIT) family protein
MDCLFCKIGSGEVPSQKIYEDEHALAFLDINPLTEGHTVIIPKIHAENILDLPAEEVAPVFLAVRRATGMLSKALGSEGFTIGINHGRISGQAVDHLHIHVIPRYKGDGGGSLHSVVNNPPDSKIEEIKTKIIEANK